MTAEQNRRQRRKPRRPGGGATCPCVASLGEYAGGDRLIAFQRGELNANKDGITGTPGREEDWLLDMIGNWPGFVSSLSPYSAPADSARLLQIPSFRSIRVPFSSGYIHFPMGSFLTRCRPSSTNTTAPCSNSSDDSDRTCCSRMIT